jgi:hypothetical protein
VLIRAIKIFLKISCQALPESLPKNVTNNIVKDICSFPLLIMIIKLGYIVYLISKFSSDLKSAFKFFVFLKRFLIFSKIDINIF